MEHYSVRVFMNTGYQDIQFTNKGFARMFIDMFTAPYKAELVITEEPVKTGFTFYSTIKGDNHARMQRV